MGGDAVLVADYPDCAPACNAGVRCMRAAVTAAPHAAAPAGDLSFASLELVDGDCWKLAKGGIGRPFTVRLFLVNRGATPLRLWQTGSAEGDACPVVLLEDAAGCETVLRPPPALRVSSVPHVTTVEPGRLLRIDLDLLRLLGPASPPPGSYRLRAVYENVISRAMGVGGVWTGRLVGEGREITIAVP